MAYVRTRGVALRCTDYSETSQVVALITPDLGQVHALAKGSRRKRKDGRGAFDVLTQYDIVLSRRAAGQLHLMAEWNVREVFPVLQRDLLSLWTAWYAVETVLAWTEENEDDGPICDALLTLLHEMEADRPMALFGFLTALLRTVGHLPMTSRCAQCGSELHGRTRFSPAAGGALCGECAMASPEAFSMSRGALAAMSRFSLADRNLGALRLMPTQTDEIQRAFDEQIQYHLGRPLRTARFLALRRQK